MDHIKRAFSTQEDTEHIIDPAVYCSLSWGARIKGFLICFIIGILLSLLGSMLLWLPFKGTVLFAMFYSLGNIFSITSTCFLMGPVKQLKKMFEETRIFAAIIMLACLTVTIISAIKNYKLLCLIFCILQSLSLTWYSLSYIPFARDAVKACCTSIVC